MNWKYDKPQCTGDSFLALMKDNSYKEIFYCPQQGWIDVDWNSINIEDISKYKSI